jgi:hypothetical protein
MEYQHPTSHHHSQTPHLPQPPPRLQQIPQATQPAPVPGGSQLPHPAVGGQPTWQQLSSDRTTWDPDAPEPVRHDGQSILMNFTMRGDKKIICRVPTESGYCDYPNVKKERLLHHMRKEHLNFLPFVCDGSCRSQTWSVPLYLREFVSNILTTSFCSQMRFASEKSRNEHIKPRMVRCSKWYVV